MDNWTCQFSEFPPEEYQTRIKRLREKMERSDLKGIIITDEKNIRYFAGGPITDLYEDHFSPFFLVIPLEASPVMVMPPGKDHTSKASWIEDRRFRSLPETGSVINQVEWLDLVETVMNEKKIDRGKIGMELSEGFFSACVSTISMN